LRAVTVRKVMIPRNRMLAADIEQDPGELLRLLANSPYSRLPLYEGSIDQIIGVVHLKDLLHLYYGHHTATKPPATVDLRQVMHKVLFIPDSLLIEDVIPQMQRTRNNVAIVVDEYGGTAGLVAFEDLIEEIIGEFQDEFDTEHPALRLRGDNLLLVRGDFQLDRLGELLSIDLAPTTVDTLGGYITDELGQVPNVGDTIAIQGIPIRVEKMEQNRVAEVTLQLSTAQLEQLERMRHE
jgi:CBS domain containing-hemolysin-like protein